tara:strand:- start:1856 stop:2332 length:477 start_codon:yes stop_codon:yes gene_type:complete
MRLYIFIFTALLFLGCGSSKKISTEELDLSNRGLKKIPAWVFKYKNLKHINLRDNLLEKFPKELSQLAKIETILLSNNLIDSLPEEINSFKELRNLDMDGNRLKRLINLKKLENLKVITLVDNPLIEIKTLKCQIPNGTVLRHGLEFPQMIGEDCEER